MAFCSMQAVEQTGQPQKQSQSGYAPRQTTGTGCRGNDRIAAEADRRYVAAVLQNSDKFREKNAQEINELNKLMSLE